MLRFVCIFAAALSLGYNLPGFGADRVIVTPQEINDLLANPGMGWQTFHTFADRDKALGGLPSSSAYFRFYWREIEPKEDEIDFKQLDGILENCRRSAQKLAFRIMCTGSGAFMDVPDWLKKKGAQGYEFRYDKDGPLHWTPQWEDPLFLESHFRLIRELGRRYDGSPDVDLLDIGSVGLWGEWHMSGTIESHTGKPVPMPLPETRLRIIDEWRKAFPRTSKVMLIGDEEGLRYAVRNGIGWRADCLGDMGGFSKNWNHMQHLYRQQIEKTGAGTAWKSAPVAFESCWDMRKWKQEGWDIPFIFDYALDLHTSYVNNKSAPLPEGSRADVDRLLKKLGYRLVLRRLSHSAIVTKNRKLRLESDWENVGVAPPYRDYRPAVRLRQIGQNAGGVFLLKDSVKGWLPGTRSVTETLTVSGLKPGKYELAIGVVHPRTFEPEIRIAIAGRAADGWYPLSKVVLR